MNLHYWVSKYGNFGDDLNAWLWDHLLPDWRDWDPSITLVGVGTILNAAHLDADGKQRYLVVGSGQGNGPPPDFERNEWDIRAIRGPRSATAIGAPPERAISDPAILVPDLPDFANLAPTKRTLLIPHVSSLNRHDWPHLCDNLGISFVSPEGDARDIIRQIAGARLVLAESMHAAILADAFRVPWIAVAMSPKFDRNKWLDWADSLGIPLEVHTLFPEIEALRALMGRRDPVRSAQTKASTPAPPPRTLDRSNTAAASLPSSGTTEARIRIEPAPRTLRLRYEGLVVRQQLRRIFAKTPQLSDTDRLRAAQTRLRDICHEIRRDYGAQA